MSGIYVTSTLYHILGNSDNTAPITSSNTNIKTRLPHFYNIGEVILVAATSEAVIDRRVVIRTAAILLAYSSPHRSDAPHKFVVA